MPIDMSMAAKAPPRKATASGATRATRSTVAAPSVLTDNERRTQGLMGLAQLGQGVCLMFGQYADAAAIGQHFPPIAKEMSNVADTSDMFAGPIDLVIEIGPYGALVAALMPMALQIAANHKWIDGSRLFGQGVVPPEVLEAQMKAQMAKMQSDAMRAQELAMREAKEAQAQYEALLREPTKEYATV